VLRLLLAPVRFLGRVLLRVVVLLVALAMAVVVVTAARVVWASRADDRRAVDAVVVLGAAQADAEPQPVLRSRLDHAFELYGDGLAPRVVTTGGTGEGQDTSEARAGALYLQEKGMRAEALVEVDVGRDTRETLEAVGARMRDAGWRSAVVVTDPPHVLRSKRILAGEDVEVLSSATRTGPGQDWWSRSRYVARETAAVVVDVWREDVRPQVSDAVRAVRSDGA